MAVTRLFRSGDSQAVRIPADLAFDPGEVDVEIERVGDELRIRPLLRRQDGVLHKFGAFSADFMEDGRDGKREGERVPL